MISMVFINCICIYGQKVFSYPHFEIFTHATTICVMTCKIIFLDGPSSIDKHFKIVKAFQIIVIYLLELETELQSCSDGSLS